jgi:triacylglycerol esterase/lipase EstA (alpha/beta hydrolase family)
MRFILPRRSKPESCEDEKLVLVGHSKGAVDILHCLVNFPQAVRHVAAVVSVAGAINGSPIAFKLDDIYTDLARNFLSGRCNAGDDGALNSLETLAQIVLAGRQSPARIGAVLFARGIDQTR